ncbi:MAG TPA: spermidine synthase [Nitrospirae bacterium]|nr:spermidine synthase [Nitrospirota bacterium]
MIPWQHLDSTQVPGDGRQLSLHRRDKEFSIRVGGVELMNSRVYGSEEALAELACAKIRDRADARILIGGLGMGFTVSAALGLLGAKARVVVAELVPAVVDWNRKYQFDPAGRPLKDRRASVKVTDVAQIIRSEREAYDAILLDVDNGPDGLTRKGNDWLYTQSGIEAAHAALRPGGALAVWSAGVDTVFIKRLRRAGFRVEEHRVRARGSRGGSRYIVWIALK